MSKKSVRSKRKTPLRISGRKRPEGTPYDEELAMMDDVLIFCTRSAIAELDESYPFEGAIWYGRVTISYALEPWRESTKPETGVIRFSRLHAGYAKDSQTSKMTYAYYPIGKVLASICIVVNSEDDEFCLLDNDDLAPVSDTIAASIVKKLMNDCEFSYIAGFRTMLDFLKRFDGHAFTKEKILKLTKPYGISSASLLGKCLDYLYFNGQLTYKSENDIRCPPSDVRGNPPLYFIQKEGE